MKTFINKKKNYAYQCKDCFMVIELAKIVPSYEEYFDYYIR